MGAFQRYAPGIVVLSIGLFDGPVCVLTTAMMNTRELSFEGNWTRAIDDKKTSFELTTTLMNNQYSGIDLP